MKKVLAVVLAAAMSLSMAAVSFAADDKKDDKETVGLTGLMTGFDNITETDKTTGKTKVVGFHAKEGEVTTWRKSGNGAKNIDIAALQKAGLGYNIDKMQLVVKSDTFPGIPVSSPDFTEGEMAFPVDGQEAILSKTPIYAIARSEDDRTTPDVKVDGRHNEVKLTAADDALEFLGGLRDGHKLNVTTRYGIRLYQYKSGDLKLAFKTTEKNLRADVAAGNIKVKQNRHNVTRWWGWDGSRWQYLYEHVLTISPNYGVRDFDIETWKIELDIGNSGVYYIEGEGAYSVTRTVGSNERLAVLPSLWHHDPDSEISGSIFDFPYMIDGETRIRCEDGGSKFVDLFFNGNYDTRKENLRVMTDSIDSIKDYFMENYDEPDIDYYDFVGRPKFASEVKVRIDADKESYIYEFDSKTGDLTNITDECTWDSNGWTFKRKYLTTYIIAEEPYEDANVSVEEPDVDEPVDEPTDAPAPSDGDGDKENPGTGANDMVGVAAALAVVSLAAAGAVAFKKASK